MDIGPFLLLEQSKLVDEKLDSRLRIERIRFPLVLEEAFPRTLDSSPREGLSWTLPQEVP